jgi:hypothetical protein
MIVWEPSKLSFNLSPEMECTKVILTSLRKFCEFFTEKHFSRLRKKMIIFKCTIRNFVSTCVIIPRVPQCLFVFSSELGPPSLLSRKRVCPTPGTKGGATLACGRGDGRTQFGRLERKPGTLYTM